MSAFLATTLLREVRERRDELKADRKIVRLGAESYVTITWKGFSTQSQVLLCFFLVAYKPIHFVFLSESCTMFPAKAVKPLS